MRAVASLCRCVRHRCVCCRCVCCRRSSFVVVAIVVGCCRMIRSFVRCFISYVCLLALSVHSRRRCIVCLSLWLLWLLLVVGASLFVVTPNVVCSRNRSLLSQASAVDIVQLASYHARLSRFRLLASLFVVVVAVCVIASDSLDSGRHWTVECD